MKKLQLLMIFLVLSILIAGCSGGPIDIQSTNVGKLILNQDQINTIEVIEGPTDSNKVTLSDSADISAVISQINDIPVKRLTKQEDIDFMPTRMQEVHLAIVFDDYNNPTRSLQGEFLIWPDGYILALDVDSMASDQRTISYLSPVKYPEIYQWLMDKRAAVVEKAQVSQAIQTANDQARAANTLTQVTAAEQFVKGQGYKIEMNSGANFDLQFPTTFNEIINGVQIGDLLKEKNELSKQNGLDFSSYLGKQVTLMTYSFKNEKNLEENIDLILEGNKIVGFWIDNQGVLPDFNVIVSAFQANGAK